MAINDAVAELKSVLEKLPDTELKTYLSTLELNDFEKTAFLYDYLYKRKGANLGLIPVLKTILEWCPVESIDEKNLKQRITDAHVEKDLNTKRIHELTDTISEVSKAIEEAKKSEEALRRKLAELDSCTLKKEDVEANIEELKRMISELENQSLTLDKESQSEMAVLFDNKDILENYEKFLSACVKSKKMLSARKDGIGAKTDEQILHEFLLVKWFLSKDKTVITDAGFEKQYDSMMEEIEGVSKKAIEFFKTYMDATDMDSKLLE